MEEVKITHNPKMEPISNKEKVGKKIDSLWNDNILNNKSSKYETKKLMVKLETNGIEKQKILLKMECGSPRVNSNNYSLISDLLKDFFNGTTDLE